MCKVLGTVIAAALLIGTVHAQRKPYTAFNPGDIVVNAAANTIFATSRTPPNRTVDVFDGATQQRKSIDLGGAAQGIAVDQASQRVYVTVDNPDRVVIMDGATGAIAATIGMPASPSRVFVNRTADRAYVFLDAGGQGRIAVVDGRTSQATFIAVGAPLLDAAVDSRALFAISFNPFRLVIVDGATNTQTSVILPAEPWIAFGTIAVNPVTNKVYLLVNQGRALAVIDGTTSAVVLVPLPAIAHRHMVVNAATNRIYIANPVQGALTVVDGMSHAVTTVPLPSQPGAVAVNEVANTVYAGALYAGGVMVLDATTLAPFRIATGTSPGAFAVDVIRNRVYVAHNANLTVIDGNWASAQRAAEVSMAVEYYNDRLDHYVVSADPTEIAWLDTGSEWIRTGQSFGTLLAPDVGNPVCRFYLPPALGDSHLMMASPAECSATAQRFPAFIYESPEVFRIGVPDSTSGACGLGLTPMYRLWNQRPDSNHRYTGDPSVRDSMVANGYVAEGYGPDAVSMCAPIPLTSTFP